MLMLSLLRLRLLPLTRRQDLVSLSAQKSSEIRHVEYTANHSTNDRFGADEGIRTLSSTLEASRASPLNTTPAYAALRYSVLRQHLHPLTRMQEGVRSLIWL